MAMQKFRHSPLPNPPGQYDPQYMREVVRTLELYFNQLDSTTPLQNDSYLTNFIDLNTGAAFTNATGRLGWSATEKTVNLGMEYGVVQQVGLEQYALVENSTGSTIPNGTVVGFAGVGTNSTLQVSPYLADGSQPSLFMLGVLTHDLPDSGDIGYCATWGYVREVNTTGSAVSESWSVGDVLYASPTTAGGLTNVKPTAPDVVSPVAAVLTVGTSDGVMFVRPTIQQMQFYGAFSKTTTATPAAINTAYALTFDNTDISNGVAIGTPTSRLIAPESGLYQASCTIQITSSSSSAKNIWVWFRKNGTDIANSARLVSSDINAGYVPIAISATVSLDATDYIEVMFASNSTNVSIAPIAATAFAPASPAVVINVDQVQQ